MGAFRFEEYAPLGDFLMTSFVRDQAAFAVRFVKLDAAYLTAFGAKLTEVKKLEGTLKFTEDQKKATELLYLEANMVGKELNFLKDYFIDAGLSTDAIVALKRSLSTGNIEGAALQMKDLKDYIIANSTILIEQGMDAGYAAQLETHRESMAAKNALQNSVLDSRKKLVDASKGVYKALLGYVTNISGKGKLLFKGTVIEDEYNMTRLMCRMRAPKKGGGDAPTPVI